MPSTNSDYHHDDPERERLKAQADLFNGADIERLKAAIGVPARALAVGCGTGHFAARLRTEWGVPHVEGLEMNAEAAATARAHLDAVHVRDALDDAPLPSADLVYARLVARHVPDARRLAAKMAAACAPGGHVLLIDADDDTLLLWPEAPDFEQARAATYARLATRNADSWVGRKLPALLGAAGLVDLGGFALTLTSFERPPAEFAELLQPFTRKQINGLTDAECADAWTALTTQVNHFSWTMYYAWGRKPAGAASR